MTISSTTYHAIVITTIVLLAGGGYLIGRLKKKKWIESIGLVLAVILFVCNKWIFPNVYLVTQCGTVSKQVLLLPETNANNTRLSLGKHCYLINRSNASLFVETIVYGNINTLKSPEKMIDAVVASGSTKEFNLVALDYFFEPQDESVYTKQDGELKYKVSCED